MCATHFRLFVTLLFIVMFLGTGWTEVIVNNSYSPSSQDTLHYSLENIGRPKFIDPDDLFLNVESPLDVVFQKHNPREYTLLYNSIDSLGNSHSELRSIRVSRYLLTVNVEGVDDQGLVTALPAISSEGYPCNTEVTLTARDSLPGIGYVFGYWDDDPEDRNPEKAIRMYQPISHRAHYVPSSQLLEVKISINGEGSVVDKSGNTVSSFSAIRGKDYHLEAIPDHPATHYFTQWSLESDPAFSCLENPVSLGFRKEVKLKANFRPKPMLSIALKNKDGGSDCSGSSVQGYGINTEEGIFSRPCLPGSTIRLSALSAEESDFYFWKFSNSQSFSSIQAIELGGEKYCFRKDLKLIMPDSSITIEVCFDKILLVNADSWHGGAFYSYVTSQNVPELAGRVSKVTDETIEEYDYNRRNRNDVPVGNDIPDILEISLAKAAFAKSERNYRILQYNHEIFAELIHELEVDPHFTFHSFCKNGVEMAEVLYVAAAYAAISNRSKCLPIWHLIVNNKQAEQSRSYYYEHRLKWERKLATIAGLADFEDYDGDGFTNKEEWNWAKYVGFGEKGTKR